MWGPCLIIPRDEKSIKFRPKFISQQIKEDSLSFETADTLHTAVCDYHPTFNPNSIADYLELMSSDLQNSGWLYLYHLYSKYNHLPLVTFQVWKDLVRNPSCLALAIWLLDFEHDIYQRFEREFGLVWETISIHDWKKALDKTYQLYLSIGMTDAHVKDLLCQRYLNLSQEISTLSMGLKEYYFDGKAPEKVHKATVEYLVNEIHRQNLLKFQSEEKWPTSFQQELLNWSLIETAKIPFNLKIEHSHQISIILLPVYVAMKNLGMTDFELEIQVNNLTNHKIRQLRDFDQTWFNSIFEITTSYLLNLKAH